MRIIGLRYQPLTLEVLGLSPTRDKISSHVCAHLGIHARCGIILFRHWMRGQLQDHTALRFLLDERNLGVWNNTTDAVPGDHTFKENMDLFAIMLHVSCSNLESRIRPQKGSEESLHWAYLGLEKARVRPKFDKFRAQEFEKRQPHFLIKKNNCCLILMAK